MFFEIGRRKTGKVKKLPFLHLWCAGNEGRGMMRGDKGEEFRVMFLSRFCSASVVIRFVYIYIIYYLVSVVILFVSKDFRRGGEQQDILCVIILVTWEFC